MASLLLEAHFWTHSEEVVIHPEDIGAYKFHEKPDSSSSIPTQQKIKNAYADARGIASVLSNTRRAPMRDDVKQLQELLDAHRLVYQAWHHLNLLLLMLDSGVLVTLWVNFQTGNVDRLLVDRSLAGRLGAERVVSAALSDQLLLLTHPENRLTLVTLQRPLQWQQWGRLTALQPRCTVWQLPGPTTRRAERRLALLPPSPSLTAPPPPTVAVWWGGAGGEMQPWTPSGRDQDRANVLVYGVLPAATDAGGGDAPRLELLSYCRTRHDPLLVQFSALRPHTLLTVEQSVTSAGEVVVEHGSYDASAAVCRQTSAVSIPLSAEVLTASLAPDERRLLLGCVNNALLMHNCATQLTHMVKVPATPWRAAWHPHSTVVLVAGETGELRFYDLALSPVELSLLGHADKLAQALPLGQCFVFKPRVSRLVACPEVLSQQGHVLQSFLLTFERGPLTLLCLQVSRLNRGRLHASDLISQYVSGGRMDAAINLLTSLNWEQQGDEALAGLYMIVNRLLKQPLTPVREAQLEAALGSFLAPVRQLPEPVEARYGERVRNVSRRFFHHLLRHGCLEKAYRLALDLRDHDLFSDVRAAALRTGQPHLAAAAQAQQERDLSHSGTGSDSADTSSCSSDCSSSWHSDEEWRPTQLQVTDQRPAGPPPQPPQRPPKPATRLAPVAEGLLTGQRSQKPPLPPKPTLPPKPPSWQRGAAAGAGAAAALAAQLAAARLSQPSASSSERQPPQLGGASGVTLQLGGAFGVASPQLGGDPGVNSPQLGGASGVNSPQLGGASGIASPQLGGAPPLLGRPSGAALPALFGTNPPSLTPPAAFVTRDHSEPSQLSSFSSMFPAREPSDEAVPPRPLPRTLPMAQIAEDDDEALVVHFV